MTNPNEGAEKPIPEKTKRKRAPHEKKSRLAQLSLAALGVVFGDISPARYTPFGSVFTMYISHRGKPRQCDGKSLANVLGICHDRGFEIPVIRF